MSQPSTLRRLWPARRSARSRRRGPAFAQTKVAIGNFRLDRLRAPDARQGSRHLRSQRPRRYDPKIPQASRHLAIASGDIQCAATTVETWIVWNANGIATTQLFQLDKSYGADGMAVRNGINSIRDLRGKTVAASARGTAPYFTLAWMLKENGLSIRDVTIVNMEPGRPPRPSSPARTTPHDLRAVPVSVRAAPQAGKIIATTLDYRW